ESTPVSSGKKGHSTPSGIYSILQKRKWHRSNLYSAAPMPFMQRITWSGLALHAGRLPGYAASHGCIRLPDKFARKLFTMTGLGADVVVSDEAVKPRPIEHGFLFQPRAVQQPDEMLVAELGGPVTAATGGLGQTGLAPAADELASERSRSPLRILITRRTAREKMMDLQSLLAELGHDPGEIDGYLGGNTGAAIQSFQRASDLRPTGMVSDELIDALYQTAGRDKIEHHLYVRQDHRPLFDVPVLLTAPQAPLGTHVFTAMPFGDDAEKASWTALSLSGDEAAGAEAALSRIAVSATIRRRISDLLTPASTVVISDHGLGRETGKGTDFIVQPL
ncbi:MAG: L,D-transpeptidase family protein, partial [Rhizobiales bacterium]|nr:L,D-transpeptidase family protein [Hyphomicrobiales bacterium]